LANSPLRFLCMVDKSCVATDMEAYLVDQEVEAHVEQAVNSALRQRAPNACMHMASTLVGRSSSNMVVLTAALKDLAMQADQPQNPMAWILSRIGPVSSYLMTVEDLMDTMSITKGFDQFEAALADHPSSQARAHAVCAAAVPKKDGVPQMTDEDKATAEENFAAVELTARLTSAMRAAISLRDRWVHDATGRVDNPPTLTDRQLQAIRLTQEETACIRRIIFPHFPHAMLEYILVRGLREKMCGISLPSDSPICLVTVGAPGSGKSHVAVKSGVPYLQDVYGAPPYTSYVHIDPDDMISGLANNNNKYRMVANFCNHENMLMTIGQRRHMVFDGTGKDLVNTCGRVISRLKQANYRVFICIVIARYQTCLDRIKERFEKTGRNVPTMFVRQAFEAMQKSIPVYIKGQQDLADAVLVFDNDAYGKASAPRVVQKGLGANECLAFANDYLTLPPPED